MTRLLLDTQVVLWAVAEPERLSASTRAALLLPRNLLHFSAASAWEIEIKRAIGKLSIQGDLDEEITRMRLLELPVALAHTRALRALPPHHKDPFDRILVAQAQCESLVLVTADPVIRRYPVRTMAA